MSKRLKDKVAVVLRQVPAAQAGATEKQLPFYSRAKEQKYSRSTYGTGRRKRPGRLSRLKVAMLRASRLMSLKLKT